MKKRSWLKGSSDGHVLFLLCMASVLLVVLGFVAKCALSSPEVRVRIAKSGSARLEKRIEAVRALDDQALLADVARHGANLDVQLAALLKLSSQQVIMDIVKKDTRLLWEACAHDKLGEDALESIASDASMAVVARQAAIGRIYDGNRLARIVSTIARRRADRDATRVVRKAMEKLTDQALLRDIVMQFSEYELTDERIMHPEIAPGNENFVFHDMPGFFFRIKDPRALFAIAQGGRDPFMRHYAVARLGDQALLEDLAMRSGSEIIRLHAMGKLTRPQRLLAGVVANENEPLANRAAALGQLGEQRLLEEIALKANDEDISLFAVPKLTGQRALETLVAKARGDAGRKTVGQLAKERLATLRLLERAGANAGGASITISDVERLDDPQLLADIAGSTLDDSLRAAAVAKLDDQRLLADIASTLAAGGDIRIAATNRLDDQRLLARLAEYEDNKYKIDEEIDRRLLRHGTNRRLWVVQRTNAWPWWSDYHTNPALGWHWDNEGYRNIDNNNYWRGLSVSKIKEENASVGKAALLRLTDRQLLGGVAENAKTEDMRLLAARRLETLAKPSTP